MATTINTNLMFSVNRYQPVKDIAEASKSGHATNVIMGISVGLESTCLPVLIMCASILGTCLVCWYCYWVLLLGTDLHSKKVSITFGPRYSFKPPFCCLFECFYDYPLRFWYFHVRFLLDGGSEWFARRPTNAHRGTVWNGSGHHGHAVDRRLRVGNGFLWVSNSWGYCGYCGYCCLFNAVVNVGQCCQKTSFWTQYLLLF